MSKTLPKTLLGKDGSSFALIDPSTELFYRKLDRQGWLTNSLRQHVAISYVWSEWKHNPSDKLPDWGLIRQRLLYVLGPHASSAIRLETGNASRCWLDSKCVDQDSVRSKSYWIPRMDEIYASAKCTVLILRDPALLVLASVSQSMSCKIKSKAAMIDWPHSCLLSQSCTTLPSLSIDQESACLQALKCLYDGTWRKRAWIFQEILLSKNYLLSLGESQYIEIGEVGIIANLFSQRHRNEVWLVHFSDWCRRLFYLRNYYIESSLHHLSEANILQMATGLEAAVPADKIYALCGILKLKDVTYNNDHSVNEAFQIVVNELMKKGRLAWLYAVPPPLNDEGIHMDVARTTPFVLTRLSDALVGNRNKMHFSSTFIGFPVLCVGQIIRTRPLAEMLQEASDWMMKHESVDFPPDLESLYYIPKIIRRIALDLVNPLLIDPLFNQISQGLGITPDSGSRPTRVWRMIMALYTRDTASKPPQMNSNTDPGDLSAAILVDAAARSLQDRLKIVQYEFLVVWWSSNDKGSETIGLGPRTCQPGNQICSVKDDKQVLVAASFLVPEKHTVSEGATTIDAHFRGMIYSLDTVLTIQWRVKIFVVYATFSPIDMQNPVLGDHPYNDKFKDCRFDKYMKADPSVAPTLSSLFRTSWNKKEEAIYLNLLCKP